MAVLTLAGSPFPAGTRVVVEALDAVRWRVLTEIRYGWYVVPVGYVTDFLSIPRIAAWLAPRYARYTPAGILHDYLLSEYVAKGLMPPVEADQIFREALADLDTPSVRVWLLWTGVRWGALFSPYRRAGWWRTFPQVAGMTIYAIPYGLFMALLLIPLAYYSLSEAVVTRGRRRGTLST